ncbi:MAG: coproporphyrinogen dehydrogenase HemZ, partial [Oscillospiraceae bacterium]|nr:coproporphyrinogen dehydrogenase HemZ [Oscillospiraceae bacterium]
MKLYLYGHNYQYAVEQMLLTLYPGERPQYPGGRPEGERMEIRLSRGAKRTTATCLLVRGGGRWHGRAAAE